MSGLHAGPAYLSVNLGEPPALLPCTLLRKALVLVSPACDFPHATPGMDH